MANKKPAKKIKKNELVNESVVNDPSVKADSEQEAEISIAPKKKNTKKSNKSKTNTKSPAKKSTGKKSTKSSPTKSSKTKKSSTKPKKSISVKDVTEGQVDQFPVKKSAEPKDKPKPATNEKPAEKTEEKPATLPEKSVEKAEEQLKQEVEAIKEVEPTISAHDIAIAINSPAKENYSAEIADEDIEKIVAEVENESTEKALEKKRKEESRPGLAHQVDSREQRVRRALPYRIFSRILALLAFGAFGALLTRIALTNAIPAKYLWPSIALSVVVGIIIIAVTFKRKASLVTLSILNFFNLIFLAAGVIGFLSVNGVMTFLDNNLGEKTEYTIYNVFVKKESEYNNLSDVRGKDFHSISDFTDTAKLEDAVSSQVGGFVIYERTVTTIMDSATKDTSYIGLLSTGTYESALSYSIDNKSAGSKNNDAKNNYEQQLKIIGEIKVPVDKNERAHTSNLTKHSFVMYISGIDTRSGRMDGTSLSDVNIIMAVNPTTRQILLVAIPRDYYVMLHGTSGLPDKLTHAGALGGINLSMSTIEDLLGIKFDHYLRVNFNAVINLVNAIGGITVNSDVDYDITAWTNKTCVFHPGLNNLNGNCALAFARERYAYETGDRHRGENQEQVITKIFEKISSSSVLISKYSDFLNALAGSFETTITTSDITSFANMQLDDMRPWTITTYNLDGSTGMALTHSYPGQYLSVMHPDWNTVETAKVKIQEILTGTTESNTASPAEEPSSNANAENDSMRVQIR